MANKHHSDIRTTALPRKRLLDLKMLPQPNDVTCGPTSLHAVYDYFGIRHSLPSLIDSVATLEKGGTFATNLGIDALNKGLAATLYSYDFVTFDPTWHALSPAALIERLEAQLEYKTGKKFGAGTDAYVRFLQLGGRIAFDDLTPALLDTQFDAEAPVLTGLNATYLYHSMREFTDRKSRAHLDDLRGAPVGHFVVLCGRVGSRIRVADPFYDNPMADGHFYDVEADRLIRAILLGALTYDANLLVLAPKHDQ